MDGLMPPVNPSVVAAGRGDADLDRLRMVSINQSGKMDDKQMRDIANQFEAMLFRVLIKEMRKTVPQDQGLFQTSHAMQMYTDISDDYLAEDLAGANDLGIEGVIYRELKDKNDKIADPADLDRDDGGLIEIPARNTGEGGFVPIRDDEPVFVDIHAGPEMIPIPDNGPGFVDIERRRMNTAWIENP